MITMETFDAIIEAGQMAEMSNTKQSRGIADYYLNATSMQPDQLPMMTYGLQLNRLAEAPPTDLVDIESKLKNQFDILSKSGYVYKKQGDSLIDQSHSSQSLMQPTLPAAEKVTEFFNPISGRDFNKFSSKSCNQINIWREDITTVQTPVPTRFEHVDTRALTKNKIDQSKQ